MAEITRSSILDILGIDPHPHGPIDFMEDDFSVADLDGLTVIDVDVEEIVL